MRRERGGRVRGERGEGLGEREKGKIKRQWLNTHTHTISLSIRLY